MQSDGSQKRQELRTSPARKAWSAPAVVNLPPLKDLTLQTGLNIVEEDEGGGFSY